jgi:hypothetical protein
MPALADALATFQAAAATYVRRTPFGMAEEWVKLSIRVKILGGQVQTGDVTLAVDPDTPRDATPRGPIEDLRYEVAEWTMTETNSAMPVEVLGRLASLDAAKATLMAEHIKAPGKVLVLREKMRVIAKRGPGTDPDGGR